MVGVRGRLVAVEAHVGCGLTSLTPARRHMLQRLAEMPPQERLEFLG